MKLVRVRRTNSFLARPVGPHSPTISEGTLCRSRPDLLSSLFVLWFQNAMASYNTRSHSRKTSASASKSSSACCRSTEQVRWQPLASPTVLHENPAESSDPVTPPPSISYGGNTKPPVLSSPADPHLSRSTYNDFILSRIKSTVWQRGGRWPIRLSRRSCTSYDGGACALSHPRMEFLIIRGIEAQKRRPRKPSESCKRETILLFMQIRRWPPYLLTPLRGQAILRLTQTPMRPCLTVKVTRFLSLIKNWHRRTNYLLWKTKSLSPSNMWELIIESHLLAALTVTEWCCFWLVYVIST